VTPARQWRFWLVAFVLAAFALYELRGVLLPFVAGIVVAYVLHPIADRVERSGWHRTLAAGLVTVAFFLLLLLGVFLIVPAVQTQVASLVVQVPHYIDIIRETSTRWIQRVEMHIDPTDAERLRAATADFAGKVISWMGDLLKGLWSGGLALVNLLSLVFITPVVSFYFLRDWNRLIARIDSWLPRQHAGEIRGLFREIDRSLAGFARGQALACLFLGAFYSIGLSIVGLDFGLVVGIVAGVLSFIPFVGTIGGFVTSLLLAFLQFSDWRWIAATAAVFVAGHTIEANFLSPKVVGDRVGLHPVWIIFALLAGGALLGFVGVLLAVPAAASIGVLVRYGVKRYLASPIYRGEGPGGAQDRQ
jgi:predicted PurR-regulated permease PerM